ncbi:MAG: biotin/lipoyl-containing protein [Bdellovibrionota bacterium]
MSFEFKLPDIGEGVTEGEIVKWLVKAGDTVNEDQPIVEVMTDKATVEIASQKSGTIEKLLANDGDMIQVGKGLVMINEVALLLNHLQRSYSNSSTSTTSCGCKPAPSSQPTVQAASTNNQAANVLASPATRKFARESGVDLASVQGSGDLGRVTREDVERSMGAPKAASQGAASAGAPSAAPQQTLSIPRSSLSGSKQEERIPVRGIRKKIVENMRISVDHAAHFTHMDEFDATNPVEIRNS